MSLLNGRRRVGLELFLGLRSLLSRSGLLGAGSLGCMDGRDRGLLEILLEKLGLLGDLILRWDSLEGCLW